ncbi:hypothetical protein [Xanthomonas phage pXoo2107]|nr:hypothetical protein [Xanthomonas phage pXoo2107]
MSSYNGILFRIGQLARVTYPNGDISAELAGALRSTPAAGLRKLWSTPAGLRLRTSEDATFWSLWQSVIDCAPVSVPLADQYPYWRGWYREDGKVLERRWHTDQIHQAAILLFGHRASTKLDVALDLPLQTTNAWASGMRCPKGRVHGDIAALLRQRMSDIADLLAEFEPTKQEETL